MGKSTNPKAKPPKVSKPTKGPLRIGPTDFAMQHGTFESTGMAGIGGMAVRRVPVIRMMFERGSLSKDHYDRLSYYRTQCETAERSLVKSGLDFSIGTSNGHGLSAAVTSAILATARIEKDLGTLKDIARKVAVDDVSLCRWCISKHGGRERYDGKGKYIAMVPLCEDKVMKIALFELRYAAGLITT